MDLETGKSTSLIDGDVPVREFAVAADGEIAVQVGDNPILIKPRWDIRDPGRWSCVLMAQFEKDHDRLILHRCDHHLVVIDGQVASRARNGWP